MFTILPTVNYETFQCNILLMFNQLKSDSKKKKNPRVLCWNIRHIFQYIHMYIICILSVFLFSISFRRGYFFCLQTFNLNTMEWLSSDINFFSLSSILLTNFYPQTQNEWRMNIQKHVPHAIMLFIGVKVIRTVIARAWHFFFYFICLNFKMKSQDDGSKM